MNDYFGQEQYWYVEKSYGIIIYGPQGSCLLQSAEEIETFENDVKDLENEDLENYLSNYGHVMEFD